jgi:hypothetical protein
VSIPTDIAQTVVDPKGIADGKRVDDAFFWLRKQAPLDVAEPEGFDPVWVITRHTESWRSSGRTSCSTTASAPRP